jgi:hypothetical protein
MQNEVVIDLFDVRQCQFEDLKLTFWFKGVSEINIFNFTTREEAYKTYASMVKQLQEKKQYMYISI